MIGTVRREVLLPDSADRIWPAVTDPSRLSEWFAPRVDLDCRPGGAGAFHWDDGSRRAVVEVVDEPRRLCFRWAEEREGQVAESRVELTLHEVEGGTLLRVVETGLGDGGALPRVAACLGAAAGWTRVLGRLGRVAALTAAR